MHYRETVHVLLFFFLATSISQTGICAKISSCHITSWNGLCMNVLHGCLHEFTMNAHLFKGLALRWLQLCALWEKDVTLMKRNMWKMLLCIIIPSLVVFAFYLGNTNQALTVNKVANAAPSPLHGLGSCDAFYLERCLQIAYAPKNTWTNEVMKNVAAINNIDNMADVMQGFESSTELQVRYTFCGDRTLTFICLIQ